MARFTWIAAFASLFVLGWAQDSSDVIHPNLTYPAPLRTHFSTWYPEARQYLPPILVNDCLYQYSIYLGNITNPYPPGCKNCRIQPVSTCLLTNWDEGTKANMAAAAVLLGLLPTILALIGPSTLETALLAMKRPFLAFLLAAASPSVNPMRTLEYSDPAAILQVRPSEIKLPRLSRSAATIVSMAEYIFAAAALGNLCLVSYQLSVRTVCSFAQETFYMPALYAFIALFIHGLATWAISMRYCLRSIGKQSRGSLSSYLAREVLPTSCHEPAELVAQNESWLFVLITWIGSTGTVLHIIFGTLVFSSTLFLTTRDALPVVVQYFASTLVAATILRYEIAGMRQTLILPGSNERQSQHEASGTGYAPLANDRKDVVSEAISL